MKIFVLMLVVLFVVVYLNRRHRSSQVDFQSVFDLVGCIGRAEETFTEAGTIVVNGEIWKATTRAGIITKGDSVRITRLRDGLVVEVEKVPDRDVS